MIKLCNKQGWSLTSGLYTDHANLEKKKNNRKRIKCFDKVAKVKFVVKIIKSYIIRNTKKSFELFLLRINTYVHLKAEYC